MGVEVTREAAGVAVFSPGGRLLVGRPSHDGRWATIGGSVEDAESPDDAAKREVREEVGLVLDALQPLGRFADSPIYDVTYPDGIVNRYAVTMYAAVLESPALPLPDRREILDVAWVACGDLERFDLAPDMAEIIPAAFAWLDLHGRAIHHSKRTDMPPSGRFQTASFRACRHRLLMPVTVISPTGVGVHVETRINALRDRASTGSASSEFRRRVCPSWMGSPVRT